MFPATRPELNYERLACARSTCAGDTQRLGQADHHEVRIQASCPRVATEPDGLRAATDLVNMGGLVRAGRARGPAGVFASGVLAAEPGNARSRAVSVPPVSVPTRSVTGWPDQGGERGPGHGRARQAQPRGQNGAGHGEWFNGGKGYGFSAVEGGPGRVRAFQCHHRWRLTHRRERRRRHPGSPRRTAGTPAKGR